MVKIMEDNIKMDDLGGFPYFWKHPYGDYNKPVFLGKCISSTSKKKSKKMPCKSTIFEGSTVSWVRCQQPKGPEEMELEI